MSDNTVKNLKDSLETLKIVRYPDHRVLVMTHQDHQGEKGIAIRVINNTHAKSLMLWLQPDIENKFLIRYQAKRNNRMIDERSISLRDRNDANLAQDTLDLAVKLFDHI